MLKWSRRNCPASRFGPSTAMRLSFGRDRASATGLRPWRRSSIPTLCHQAIRYEGSPRTSIERMDEKRIVDQVPNQLFIAGEWRDAYGGKTLAVEDPSTGEVIAHVADASVADGTAA